MAGLPSICSRKSPAVWVGGDDRFSTSAKPTGAQQLLAAAAWLATRPRAFEAIREQGLTAIVRISGWIDCDQLDLDLPVEFLAACAAARLPVSTNESSVP
jgi:hypothetical protein